MNFVIIIHERVSGGKSARHTIFAILFNDNYFTFRVVSMCGCTFHFVCGGIVISRDQVNVQYIYRMFNWTGER